MKITSVSCLLISEKLTNPWVMGLGTAYKRDELLVFVDTNEGITGIGSSYHGHTPHAIKALIETKLGPLVVGQDPRQIQSLWEKMFFGSIHLGSAAAQAIAGIDIALWDILGKVTGQPVYRLLGGGDNSGAGPRLTTYVGCQTLGIRDDLEALADEAAEYVAQGFKAVKVRGGAGVPKDLAAIAAVRDRVGEDIDVMIDTNARYSWPEAARLAKRLQDYNIFWLEDPFDFTIAHHKRDAARLRGLGQAAIASGGNVFTRFDFEDLVRQGGVDYLTPDVVKSAGISECMKIAAIASAANIIIAQHTYNGVGQVANLHFAAAIPAHIRGHVEWDAGKDNAFRDVLVTPAVQVEDGAVTVPDAPGLGIELVEDFRERFAYEEGPEIVGVPRKRTWAVA
ncbi:mandelate racemase/muconate lactonizing enzyme family protein [Rhizomonospora bruguierae]|uniref:mandelate racemase/muconate lactonizing enzyme family protein n=1 Tax=Rhizomonospora bruguierae TaxID=1581705 RepID=UPI001BD03D5C|nr:mandelate racemase/muconate lactonizing enzyme family protein [Micromonospora sp. NBRC 107566]